MHRARPGFVHFSADYARLTADIIRHRQLFRHRVRVVRPGGLRHICGYCGKWAPSAPEQLSNLPTAPGHGAGRRVELVSVGRVATRTSSRTSLMTGMNIVSAAE